VRGAVKGHRQRHNMLMSIAWHTARLTAYAPQKPREFIPLKKLLQEPEKKAPTPSDWRAVLAKVQVWAGRKG